MDLSGLTAEQIACTCAVDLATARRWKRGAARLPVTASALLARDLGCWAAAWAGWCVSERGELCSPEGLIFSPGEVRSLPFQLSLTASLRAELQTYRDAAAEPELEEQPTPDSWPELLVG